MDEEDAFTEYASARWGTLVRAAVFLGCSTAEAQDLTQATLLRCYTSWARVQAAADRDAYTYRILLNAFRDSRRRRWSNETPSLTFPDQVAADSAEQVAVADAVHRALAALSARNREVVILRYFAQLSESQTADILDIPNGTVKSRLSRALTQLAADPNVKELA